MDAAALDRPFAYDPYSAEARRDPYAFYPTLRDDHPAWFMPDYDAYAISRFADVWDAFLDTEHFSEAEGQVFGRSQLLVHHRGDPPKPRLDPKSMFLFLDAPFHTNFRRALAPPFLKGSVNKLEPVITTLVRDRLAALLPQGRFDLNADFGSYVSVGATSHLMGIPLGEAGRIIDLVNRMVARDPARPGPTEDGMEARAELIAFLADAVAARRRDEGKASPVIDPLIRRDTIGRPLTDAEIAEDLLAILVGGTETIPKVFAGGLLDLASRPDQLAAVRADVAANAPVAFEEMLRYNAPAQWFGRTAVKPRALAGVMLEPGQRVILLIAAANRDPREFEDGDAFVWNRPIRRLLSFGIGPHFCIGIHLARLEGQIMLREFLSMAPDFAIDAAAGERAVSEFQVGWTSLPVRVGQSQV